VEEKMIYPAYIHKDKRSAWGATLPDFPGCFAAADALDDLPAAVQEAVEVYCEGEAMDVPAPTAPDALPRGKAYTGGQWLLLDIDVARVNPRAVRLNVSLPENLLQRIDAYARTHGATRSGFLAEAARRAMADNERVA
jgi:predicted RNase H-like HicB family nuclease